MSWDEDSRGDCGPFLVSAENATDRKLLTIASLNRSMSARSSDASASSTQSPRTMPSRSIFGATR